MQKKAMYPPTHPPVGQMDPRLWIFQLLETAIHRHNNSVQWMLAAAFWIEARNHNWVTLCFFPFFLSLETKKITSNSFTKRKDEEEEEEEDEEEIAPTKLRQIDTLIDPNV